MIAIVLYDDVVARGFEPLALTRPVSELRAGTELVRRRWETALGGRATAFVGAPHLADLEELDAPRFGIDAVPAGTVIANARFAPTLSAANAAGDVWRCEGRVAAIRVPDEMPIGSLADGSAALEELVPNGARTVDVDGWWLDEVWDLIRYLPAMLASDIPRLCEELDTARVTDAGATVIGQYDARVERGASIEPYVVFDATAGPILVRRGSIVASFTRLVGPCCIGEQCIVAGGRIAGTSVGEHCRVHGELSTTVFLGHSNKSHDGFVGHSYLGRWTNLGAGTITSNLKNTYGPVALWSPRGMRDTGMQFLGTFFGDHAKTAIGTRLTTGGVVGAGANVFTAATTPKVIAPFSWGGEGDAPAYEIDRFLTVAERVMGRRQVVLSDRARRWLTAAYAARWQVA